MVFIRLKLFILSIPIKNRQPARSFDRAGFFVRVFLELPTFSD